MTTYLHSDVSIVFRNGLEWNVYTHSNNNETHKFIATKISRVTLDGHGRWALGTV